MKYLYNTPLLRYSVTPLMTMTISEEQFQLIINILCVSCLFFVISKTIKIILIYSCIIMVCHLFYTGVNGNFIEIIKNIINTNFYKERYFLQKLLNITQR